MNQIKQILMYRDGMSAKEADEVIKEAKDAIKEGEDPEEILYEMGLESDYIYELL